MAQNITLLGANYPDVPAVDLPKTGGGTARFSDASITTALEADVSAGKIFLKADGSIATGTGSGGGGTGAVWQDQQGYINLDDEEGGSVTVEALSVTSNGTYTAPAGKAYSPVTVNVSGGGGGSWMGSNPVKRYTFTPEHVLLKDSVLATWTWTTTNTTVRTPVNYPTITADTDHDYIEVFRYYIHYDYGNWTPKAAITDFVFNGITTRTQQATTLANAQSETPNSWVTVGEVSRYHGYYYNTAGALTYTTYMAYGLNMTTIASISGTQNNLICSTPYMRARGDANYFSQEAFNNLDMEASYYDITCELWSVDKGTSMGGWAILDSLHILNNGV